MTDAAHEKEPFHNDDVRIVEVMLAPHARETMHTDGLPAILFVDQPGRIRDVGEVGGTPAPQELGPGVVRTTPAGMHALENASDTPLHFFRVELKHALPTT